MKTRFAIIVLLLIVLGAGFQGCRSTLDLLTKHAKRTIINTRNERYDLVVKINYSTGNQPPSFAIEPEKVVIVNGKLTEVINGLSEQPTPRVVYQNKHHKRKMKLDITFNYKGPFSNSTPHDTLLRKLAERLEFKLVVDSVAQTPR